MTGGSSYFSNCNNYSWLNIADLEAAYTPYGLNSKNHTASLLISITSITKLFANFIFLIFSVSNFTSTSKLMVLKSTFFWKYWSEIPIILRLCTWTRNSRPLLKFSHYLNKIPELLYIYFLTSFEKIRFLYTSERVSAGNNFI